MEPSFGAGVSISKLCCLEERIQKLRQKLCNGFLNFTPFIEVAIFTELESIMRDQLKPYLENQSDCSSSEVVEARQVISYYIQDLLASALYLIDEKHLKAVDLKIHPFPNCPSKSSNVSAYYVSASQRHYCAELFFYLCWCRWIPTYLIIQALYPLLDIQASKGSSFSSHTYDDTKVIWKKDPKQQNQIIVNLLSKHHSKRVLVVSTLNGIVVMRHGGIASLLRTLLLNDRVEVGMTAEASGYIVRLLLLPMRSIWFYDHFGEAMCEKHLFFEEQLQLISKQMIALFEAHTSQLNKCSSFTSDLSEASPLLRQLALANNLLPKETVEERLHFFLTRWLNACLQRHSQDSLCRDDRSEAYRRLFYVNKYFLTPAFAILTLRRSALQDPAQGVADATLASLRRTLVLSKGAAAGASIQGFLTVLHAIAPGILNLMALEGLSEAITTTSHALWRCVIELSSSFEEVAQILVHGVVTETKGRFLVSNRVESCLHYTSESGCSPAVRARGLYRVLQFPMLPPELSRCCFVALATECITCLYDVSMANGSDQSSFTVNGKAFGVDDNPLLSILEEACLTWPADRIFGAHSSLEKTFLLFTKTLQISTVTAEWTLSLLASLLKNNEAFQGIEGGVEPLSKEEVELLETNQLNKLRLRARLLSLKGILQEMETKEQFFSEKLQQQASAKPLRIQSILDMLDRKIAELSFHEDRSKISGAAVIASVTAARSHDSLTQKFKKLCENLSDALMASQPTVFVTVIVMRLSSLIEDATFTIKDVGNAFREVSCFAVRLFIKVLYTYPDSCVSVHTIRCLSWIGMYRFDSIDSTVLASYFCKILNQDERAPLTAALCDLFGLSVNKKQAISIVKLSQIKIRVLDVLLSWCDYDEDSLTLRNVDHVCTKVLKFNLFELLAGLCKPPEEAVVQVAALHLIGCYVVSTSSRIALRRVLQLAVDVFRHTPVAMAKAACASMLAHIASTLLSQSALITLQEVDLDELLNIAHAMETYRSTQGSSISNDDLIHEEVVRKHGCNIVKLLQTGAQKFLISEV